MTVLVTGAAGFIGSHLCASLLRLGERVIAVDNLSLSSIDNVKDLIKFPNFIFYKVDVNDIDMMRSILNNWYIEMIYHLASNTFVSKGEEGGEYDFRNTFESTLNVLHLMKDFSIKKLFFSSSSCIYGLTKEPINENNCSIHPISFYGAAKLASEAFISAFAEKYDIQVWIARFSNVIGDKMNHGVIHDFINRLINNSSELTILGGEESTKPFIYISDAISAILTILHKANDKYNVFVVGNDTNTSILKVAELVVEKLGANTSILCSAVGKSWLGDVEQYYCDNTKIKNLGWSVDYTSDQAVMKTIDDLC